MIAGEADPVGMHIGALKDSVGSQLYYDYQLRYIKFNKHANMSTSITQ